MRLSDLSPSDRKAVQRGQADVRTRAKPSRAMTEGPGMALRCCTCQEIIANPTEYALTKHGHFGRFECVLP